MNLEELQKDEQFKASIEHAESYAEVAALFKEKGLEVTEEELRAVVEAEASGELSENMLEEVAGGMLLRPWPGFPRIPGLLPPPILGWPRRW